ncbi:nitroreductase [Mesorhizobium sp. M0500]|uniref:nitroreductase n=1 Tax=Mesorhizobium sp. M0500 TaxID=2956953 RepID=UPI003335DEC7
MTATDFRASADRDASVDVAAQLFGELIRSRFSCRAFRGEAVPRTTIEAILSTAQRTPSWCNTQPWQSLVLSGTATRAFAEAYRTVAATQSGVPDFDFPAAYKGKYQQRRRECGWQLYDSVGVKKGDREASAEQALQNYRFFGAPHLVLITTDRDLGVYGAVDCGGYVAMFTLAALSHGVHSVPQAALATHPNFVRNYFGLPEDQLLVCGIAFGYADLDHPANGFRTSRAGLDEAVAWLD